MSWEPIEQNDTVYRGATYELPFQAWADQARSVPWDVDGVTFKFIAWFEADAVVLELGSGITVQPGKEAVGDEPAEPTAVTVTLTDEQTAAIPAPVEKARYVLAFTSEGKTRWLFNGTLTVKGP